MAFYELTHPRYETDDDYEAANPVQPVQDTYLPGLTCAKCGQTWAGSRRLYLPITDLALKQRLQGPPLLQAQWSDLANALRTAVGLPDDFPLEPGDILGTPMARLASNQILDFLHPFPGQLIVRGTVVDALQRAALTGFRPIRVEIQWDKPSQHPVAQPPDLYELIVTGTAWRVDSDPQRLVACHQCGRMLFPNPDWLVVDESRWDGSDFFHVDRNPNIVLVTDRVCTVLEQAAFTNYVCNPVLPPLV